MKQDSARPVKIPASQAQRLMPWELPTMDIGLVGEPFKTVRDDSQVLVTEEEIEAEKLTLADIEEIRENAAKEGFQQGHQEGFTQGYTEGKQQGYEQAYQAGQAEVQRQLTLLESMLNRLENPIASQEEALEGMLINLVKEFSRSVIHAELKTDSEPLLQAIQAALAELPSAVVECEVHLHPDDLRTVQTLAKPLTLKKGVKWIADDGLEQGGCLIHSENTLIDNRVSARFEQIVQQLDASLGQLPESSKD